MSFAKRKILFTLISAIFLFSCLTRADSIDAFRQKDVNSQIEFINSLSKQEKFSFLQKFLPGSCFYAPPATDIIFLSDGRALNYDQGYFYTRWSMANNIFKIWKQKPSDPFPEETEEEILIDYIASNDSIEYVMGDGTLRKNPSLWFDFSDSKDGGLLFRYSPGCMGYFIEGNYEYERYKKSLTQAQRTRLEELNPPIKPSSIVDDKQTDISNYSGVYDFGVSEHWDLVIVVAGGQAYVQSLRAHLSPDDGKWRWECHNFEDVEILGNKLTAKTVTGRFVIATIERKNKTGLMLSWKHDGKEELGKKYSVSLPEYLHGKYPETYLKRLDERDLANKTKQDLKIMRNEIYARYGYQFKPNGSMDKYFRSQLWYQPRVIDVNNCITEVEKENLKFIQAHE